MVAAGYDTVTQMSFDDDALEIRIPDNPTLADAVRSVEQLRDVVCDFPFEQPAHFSAWLAFLLSPLATYAFNGPTPLTLVDANVRGSGKSLLAGLVLQGHNAARMSNPRDDEECRKRITSLAIAGDPLILIDNVVGSLGCASIDAALTGTRWSDRLLGKSETVDLPLLATWVATGNNVALNADICRQLQHVQLCSDLEQPETRSDYRHADIRGFVLAHRSELLSAALTILRAHFVAGRPDQSIPSWGSFEGWSAVVRAAIVWAGQPDPADTRKEFVESGDRELSSLRTLIDQWSLAGSTGRRADDRPHPQAVGGRQRESRGGS